MKAGEKQALSQTLTTRGDGDMPDNLRLFLSETTPPTPPDTVLHSRTHKAVIRTQQTLCVYALLLMGITYFLQFTKSMGSMSREKFGKIGNIIKIRIITYFFRTFVYGIEKYLFVRKIIDER